MRGLKYTIETTENGCIETLEFSDGSKFTKRSTRTEHGCQSEDDGFAEQLERDGFCEEIIDKVWDSFDEFGSLNFLEIAEFERSEKLKELCKQ